MIVGTPVTRCLWSGCFRGMIVGTPVTRCLAVSGQVVLEV